MTVNTVETVKNDEEDQAQAQNQSQEQEEEEEEKEKPRISETSPHSSFSLSPLSNRSYKTPSPSVDHIAYFDQAHDVDGFTWAEHKPTKPRPPLAQPNRSFPAEPLVVTTKALDPEAQDGVVSPVEEDVKERDDDDVDTGARSGNGSGGLGSFNRRKLRPGLSNRKRTATQQQHGFVKRALLGFRISGFVFCLISFSVMAANRNQGWALDSFYRYKEFRLVSTVY